LSQKEKQTVGETARLVWLKLSPLPGGKWLFSRLSGLMIPYTGSMKANVEHLEPGYAVVFLKDRRRVRNHLKSIHAIAIANLAEYTTGLATLTGMPPGSRAILTALDVRYVKKARGKLRSECRSQTPATLNEQEVPVEASIYDMQGDCVATATATWLIGPDSKTAGPRKAR